MVIHDSVHASNRQSCPVDLLRLRVRSSRTTFGIASLRIAKDWLSLDRERSQRSRKKTERENFKPLAVSAFYVFFRGEWQRDGCHPRNVEDRLAPSSSFLVPSGLEYCPELDQMHAADPTAAVAHFNPIPLWGADTPISEFTAVASRGQYSIRPIVCQRSWNAACGASAQPIDTLPVLLYTCAVAAGRGQGAHGPSRARRRRWPVRRRRFPCLQVPQGVTPTDHGRHLRQAA
jgi:hypothetical protein